MVEPVRALIKKVEEGDQAPAAGLVTTVSADPLWPCPNLYSRCRLGVPPISTMLSRPSSWTNLFQCQVLAGAGQRVQELVQDINRFTADEDLFHKSLDGLGFQTTQKQESTTMPLQFRQSPDRF